MANNYRRDLLGTSSSEHTRASWSASTVQLFLQLLAEEKNTGNWAGKSATTNGYQNVANSIHRQTSIEFTKMQLKSKFDALKSEFHLWTNLFNGQTDAGYDAATGKITMDEEWWEKKITENDRFKKLKNKGLKNGELMYIVFGDNNTTGRYQYTPTLNYSEGSTSPTPHQSAEQNQEVNSLINMGEGSGRRSSLSGGKRKFNYEDSWNASMASLTNALEYINRPRELICRHIDPDAEAAKKALDLLHAIPEVSPNSSLFFTGLNLLADKNKRNVFLCLREDATRLMWLKMNEK